MIRIAGTRYTRQLVRVTEPDAFTPVWAQMQLQMGAPEAERTWIYRLDPRPAPEGVIRRVGVPSY